VAVRQLNWQCQLHNGQGGRDNNNSSNDNDNINAETTTTKTASTAVGSIGINAGTDMVAALCQGSTTQGKRIRRQCQHQHFAMTGIGTSK
jgi:hypothetical protein